jgi:hypothetical protein
VTLGLVREKQLGGKGGGGKRREKGQGKEERSPCLKFLGAP